MFCLKVDDVKNRPRFLCVLTAKICQNMPYKPAFGRRLHTPKTESKLYPFAIATQTADKNAKHRLFFKNIRKNRGIVFKS